MGWHAVTSWDLTFNDEAAVAAAAAEFVSELTEAVIDPTDFPLNFIALFNEDSDGEFTGLRLTGWGSGKAWDLGPAPDMREWTSGRTWNAGGENYYSRLAPFVTGIIDWEDQDGGRHWRVRFSGGDWAQYEGKITYDGDPGA